MNAANILDRLEGVRLTGDGKWIARCPAHEDRSPSLSVRECDDGRVLVHCFPGCQVGDVTAAIGLRVCDLFPPENPSERTRRLRVHRAEHLQRILWFERLVLTLAESDRRRGKLQSIEDARRTQVARERVRRLESELRL